MKKPMPLWTLILTGVLCIFLSVIITMQLCARYMLLDTREEYERKLSDLTKELDPDYGGKEYTDPASKFKAAYDLFTDNYIGKIDNALLSDILLDTFISQTGDEYAKYYDPEEYAAYQTKSAGKTAGIGVTVSETPDGRMVVIYVEKDSPAERAGIKVGFEILAADRHTVKEEGYDAVCAFMQGEAGKELLLTLLFDDNTEHELSIERKILDYSTVRYSLEDGNIGYIRILSFASNTFEQFKKAVDDLAAKGAEKLIFDLRANEGGTLESLRKTLDYLIEDKDKDGNEQILMRTVDAKKNENQYVCSDEHAVALPMAVLTDEKTASSAELFACALRDYEMAKIVGKTTFGKGTAQGIVTMKDGSALIMTVAFCDPPKSENFDKKGVKPDIEADDDGINIYLIPLSEDPVYLAAKAVLDAG